MVSPWSFAVSRKITGSVLVAVVSDARRRNWPQARWRLEQRALPLARTAGEGSVQRTVFGPTNVALHAMSIEMLASDAAGGLRLADQVDTSRLPSRERQFTFGLEVARCYHQRHDAAAILVHLLSLEELAPRTSPAAPRPTSWSTTCNSGYAPHSAARSMPSPAASSSPEDTTARKTQREPPLD
ncbi:MULTISPECIES: hypothetical protein [unclassified Streptomyces]|uniref:hypothetical protein n=1 Tax=unclassified Streptomyces TaxID=2593676 RepID=UPI0024758071|nr:MULTISPECIES: hypothetical protein [unclassified Streptomyces]